MIPFLSVKELYYTYHSPSGETAALKNISFDAAKGDFLAVVGPSGCGKSTLLSLIAGLLSPEQGSIELLGIPIEKQRSRIGYMLQKDLLFEWRSILKNIQLGLEINHCLDQEHQRSIQDLLKKYGLFDFQNAKPSQLSGGMRQRAALIRTLALKPDLILLDEPFSALDYQTRLQVGNDIGTILHQEHMTAILITHDISEAIRMADRILVLTHRPGEILDDIVLDFSDLSEDTPLNRSNTAIFHEYFNLIWKELNPHEPPNIKSSETISVHTAHS